MSLASARCAGGANLPAEDLTDHLKRLRVRAGNPSVRDLAKLTERQGPGRAMTRSTVQDKISGKNPPRLGQILALVQACADYARSIGAPLPVEDTEEQIWRERAQAASTKNPPLHPVSVEAAANRPAKPTTEWDLDPLTRAGMYDMVELIQSTEGQPMAEWLVPIVHALDVAGMSNEQFLKAASMEQPRDLVESIMELAVHREKALDRLMLLCAVNQPAEAIPAVMVLLRRKENPEATELADRFISLMSGERLGRFFKMVRNDCLSVVLALRAATLYTDATRLLSGIGEHRDGKYILELAASLPDSIVGDRETILSSVGKGGRWHLCSVLEELQKTTLDGIDRHKTLDRIIFGIPSGEHEEISYSLRSNGLDREATRVDELKDKPPF